MSKLFRRIYLGLWLCFAVFIFLDRVIIGAGLILTLVGILSLVAFYFNIEPLGVSIGGFDYGMRILLKEYYNKFFNLFWGLIQLTIGILALYKFFN